MATNLALQLQVIEPDTDLNSIMIGNSRYSDDIWDLRPFITAKSTKESQKYIRFEYISDADMKKTVKQYAYDKKKLIVQLVDYEELKSENERLKKQLAKK